MIVEFGFPQDFAQGHYTYLVSKALWDNAN